RLVEVAGQRQLDEQAVDALVRVQLRDQREELVLGRLRGQPQVARLDADRLGGPLLAADVDVGGRVVADEHRGEPDVAETGDPLGDLLADAGGERLAVDQRRCHRPEPSRGTGFRGTSGAEASRGSRDPLETMCPAPGAGWVPGTWCRRAGACGA